MWTKFYVPVQTGPGVHPVSCTTGTESLPLTVKRPEHFVYHPPNFRQRFKKEYSYTSTSPMGLHGLLLGNLYLLLLLVIMATELGTIMNHKYEGRTESHEQLFLHANGNSRRRRVRW